MKSYRRFLSHWQNWLGLILVVFFILVAATAPWLSPQDPQNPGPFKVVGKFNDLQPHPPNEIAPLGTLAGQASVFHALVWGTRSALVFGVLVAVCTAFIGSLVGAVSAYFGGFLNKSLMGITDGFLSFPIIAGVVLIQQLITTTLYNTGVRFSPGITGRVSPSFFFPEGVTQLIDLLNKIDPILIAFILFSWMPYARIMNTIVHRVKQEPYIEASRAQGAGHSRLIFKHLIPNSISPIIVLAARDVGWMVLLQSTFSFIGMGDSSPWGILLARGRDWIITGGGMLTYWWVFLPATIALVLFGIGWNLLGDGLNDAINPRTR
jgi:peptide/nickel transport system permease protein